jgi:membrane protein
MAVVRKTWSLLTQTLWKWSDDKVPQLGAALSFYTAVSIAPLMVLLLRLASILFGAEAARGEVQLQLRSLVGIHGARAIEEIIAGGSQSSEGPIATVFGIAVLLFGASGVFAQLQDSLNTIWKVRTKPGRGIVDILRDRFFSFVMVLGVAFLLLVSLVVNALLALASRAFYSSEASYFPIQLWNSIISFVVITLLFAAMYKWVPDARIAWSDVWLGALMTSGLFSFGKYLIGLYFGYGALGSVYGVAGSFVVILIWVYYSAQILYFGAELTEVYASQYAKRIIPKDNAEPLPSPLP